MSQFGLSRTFSNVSLNIKPSGPKQPVFSMNFNQPNQQLNSIYNKGAPSSASSLIRSSTIGQFNKSPVGSVSHEQTSPIQKSNSTARMPTSFQKQTDKTVSQIALDLIQLFRNQNSAKLETKSKLEENILNSTNPIKLNETQEIVVNGVKGLWANKSENLSWAGQIPLENYKLKKDSNPEVIFKKPTEKVKYTQEITVRYLNPPQPPKPGNIIIKQEPNKQAEPAPPLIIRQSPPRTRAPTPRQIIIREEPPKTPEPAPTIVYTVPGKVLPPPSRKVIVEKLPEIPDKPSSILIERWLPYPDVKRTVVFQKSTEPDVLYAEPRNLIFQWEKPDVEIQQSLKHLEIIEANPAEYRKQFSSELIQADKLPEYVLKINPPEGVKLAANQDQVGKLPELEGDVEAMRLVDLDQVGLSEYKQYLTKCGIIVKPSLKRNDRAPFLIEDLFRTIDRKNKGVINVEDAEKVVLRLNSRFGRRYGEDDVDEFFSTLDTNRDGTLDLNEFKQAFYDFGI